MPLWKDTPTEGEHAPHRGMQGPSRRFATNYTYPDPASVGTQTLQASNPYKGYPQPSPADAMAIEPDNHLLPNSMLLSETRHEMVCYSQSEATSLATNVWGGSGVSPYTPSSLNDNGTLDPALRGNDFWSSQSLDFNQQLLQASSSGDQYNGSSFRDTNMPAQGTNIVTEGFPNSPNHPFSVSPYYIPPPTVNEVEGANSCPHRTKRRLLDFGSVEYCHEDVHLNAVQTQHSELKRRCSTRKNLAPVHPTQQLDPIGPPSAVTIPTLGNRSTLSKLGQKKVMLGDRRGDDNRARAETREEDGVLYGLVDNEWKAAGYHRQFREKLIQIDAQQPGAPVRPEGMSLNCISYSPITHSWTEDPSSMRDSEGQEVMFLPTRPPHLPHNPKCGHLMCEGLVMLDQNNRPIKAYPGAPRTLATNTPGYFVEGLRRIFGMTINDSRARMPGERETKSGEMPLQGPSCITNRCEFWVEKKGLSHWHKRKARKAARTKGTIRSGQSNEGESATVSIPDSGPDPTPVPDDLGSETMEWDDFVDL